MSSEILHLNIQELAKTLEKSISIRGSDVLSNRNILIRSESDQFQYISDDTILHVRSGKIIKAFDYVIERKNYITLQFVKCGEFNIQGDGHNVRSRRRFVRINNFSTSVARFDRIGSNLSGISIITTGDALASDYGLDLGKLSPMGRLLLTGSNGGLASIELPMSPEIMIAVDNIVGCKMRGVIRSVYQASKAKIILCRLVELLGANSSSTSPVVLSTGEIEQRAIQSAALIYQRELRAPPAIDEVARRVGMNRNKLIDGFRELYGMTPGSYSRQVRLQWADRRLEQDVSIAIVAREVGYDAASFSRAYKRLFGRLPSDRNGIGDA